jgi:hypothetical protein
MLGKFTPTFAFSPDDPDRSRRVPAAACFGLLSGTLVVLVSGTINRFAFPELSMRVDWPHMAGLWLLLGPLLGALCGLAAYTTEMWPGSFLAGFGMALAMLVTNIAQGQGAVLTNIVLLVILLIPLTGMMTPVALVFRWLGKRFVDASVARGPRRFAGFAFTVLLAILLGLAPGMLARMNAQAQTAVLHVKTLLDQEAAPGVIPDAFGSLPGYRAHAGAKYSLSQRESAASTEAFDVSIHFADGYTITCIVVAYPERDPYIDSCREEAR